MKTLLLKTVTLLGVLLLSGLGGAAENAAPRVTLDLSGHPVKGPANAPVTVVVFSDYL
ncbi:MAG: hypothetical protein HGA98_02180 [Deltaproteobacteria bacterium]|nr:hypothetical protein [Deltaproteobacteria bacterium]